MASPTPRILIAGLPASLASWLAQRLEAVVEVAFDGDEALESARTGGWGLLMLEASVSGLPAETLIQRLRERPDTAAIPILLASDAPDASNPDRLERMVRQHGVERVLMHPIDRGELARQASDLMHRPLQEPAQSRGPTLSPMLEAIWNRSLPQIQERVAAVQRAVAAAAAGTLQDAERRSAGSDAHKLAGILGTLGVAEGSRLARDVELALEAGAETAAGLGGVAEALAAQVAARGTAATGAARPASGDAVCVVGGDPSWARELDRAAVASGVRVRWAPRASEAAADVAPAALLVDLEDGGAGDDVLAELATRLPGTPIMVMAGRDSLLDRVRALQLGARTFLQKPVGAADALEILLRVVGRGPEAAVRVLAVDDDPAVIETLQTLLEPDGVEVQGENDPLRFWSTLQRVKPELLILDVDMPQLNGIELCRVVRADPRWGRLPVVFLTARADRDTLLRVFAAGADDYLTKPIVGPELSVRIRARLERARTA